MGSWRRLLGVSRTVPWIFECSIQKKVICQAQQHSIENLSNTFFVTDALWGFSNQRRMKDLEALHSKEKPTRYQRRLQVVADFVHMAASPLFVLDATLLTLSKEYLTKEEETEALVALAISFAVMANFISFVVAGTFLAALFVSTFELFWQGVYTKTPALKSLGSFIGLISIAGIITVWVGIKASQAKTGSQRVRRTTLFVSLTFFAAPACFMTSILCYTLGSPDNDHIPWVMDALGITKDYTDRAWTAAQDGLSTAIQVRETMLYPMCPSVVSSLCCRF